MKRIEGRRVHLLKKVEQLRMLEEEPLLEEGGPFWSEIGAGGVRNVLRGANSDIEERAVGRVAEQGQR